MASLWLGPPREGLRPWVFHKEHVRTAKVKKEKVSHLLSLSDQLNKCGRGKESHLQLFPEATVLTTSTHGFPQCGASETCPPHKKPLWNDGFRALYRLRSDPYVFTCFSVIFVSSLSVKLSL